MPGGEIILDAALSQGVALPHQCRGASCGTCKAKVLEGAVDHGWALGLAITDQEQSDGFCLMCQARPITDRLTLETVQPLPGSDAAPIVSFDAQVLTNEPITPRVRRLVLEVPREVSFRANAGSYLELALPGVFPNRRYSLSTVRAEQALIELLVARHPDGVASCYVHDILQPGDFVGVRGPFGTCHLPAGSGPVLGLAGGTGLAPVFSILEQALLLGDTSPMTLLLSVREDSELMLLDRLAGLSRAHENFRYVPLVTETASRFCTRRQYAPSWLREQFTDLSQYRAVVGGSPGFVLACSDACITQGMPRAAISADSFTAVTDG